MIVFDNPIHFQGILNQMEIFFKKHLKVFYNLGQSLFNTSTGIDVSQRNLQDSPFSIPELSQLGLIFRSDVFDNIHLVRSLRDLSEIYQIILVTSLNCI